MSQGGESEMKMSTDSALAAAATPSPHTTETSPGNPITDMTPDPVRMHNQPESGSVSQDQAGETSERARGRSQSLGSLPLPVHKSTTATWTGPQNAGLPPWAAPSTLSLGHQNTHMMTWSPSSGRFTRRTRSHPVSPVTAPRGPLGSLHSPPPLSFAIDPMMSGSGVPLPPPPPEWSKQRQAMEAAAAAERRRAQQCQAQEVDLDADALRRILHQERQRTAHLAAEFAALRAATCQAQVEAEVLEEGRINHLMRQLESLQQEKGRLALELEREEEMLTNTLQKRLDEVRKEKEVLQQQIDREHLHHSALQEHYQNLQQLRLPEPPPPTSLSRPETEVARVVPPPRPNHLPTFPSVAESLEEEDEIEEED